MPTPSDQKLSVSPGPLPGVRLLTSQVFEDERGSLTKLYHQATWARLGLKEDYVESFVSISETAVLRGMHFQLPPADHSKVVWLLKGKVLDVLLDLRRGQSRYGDCAGVVLAPGQTNGIYMPVGFAHGFYVLEGPATLLYMTTSLHDPEHDSGIRWDSFGFDWPSKEPVVSERDLNLPPFSEFESPWTY